MASNDDTSWHVRAEIALLAALRAGQAITYELYLGRGKSRHEDDDYG